MHGQIALQLLNHFNAELLCVSQKRWCIRVNVMLYTFKANWCFHPSHPLGVWSAVCIHWSMSYSKLQPTDSNECWLQPLLLAGCLVVSMSIKVYFSSNCIMKMKIWLHISFSEYNVYLQLVLSQTILPSSGNQPKHRFWFVLVNRFFMLLNSKKSVLINNFLRLPGQLMCLVLLLSYLDENKLFFTFAKWKLRKPDLRIYTRLGVNLFLKWRFFIQYGTSVLYNWHFRSFICRIGQAYLAWFCLGYMFLWLID